MSDAVLLDVADGIARLTLNRPDSGNAVTLELTAALHDRARSLHERDDVRVVVLQAAGRSFSVGGDLRFMHEADDVERSVHRLATQMHAGMDALATLDAPVITAVKGSAAGGGMSIAVAGDLVIAAASARLTTAYAQIGFPPDGGASWTLPRIVGLRRSMELLLLSDGVDAPAALAMGLVTRVVPDDELTAEVDALARRLADGNTAAYGAVKRLVRASSGNTFEEHVREEAATIARFAASPAGREGVSAFLEKRRPRFGPPR